MGEADNLTPAKPQCGDVAQLAERYLCKVDVRGSIPLVSTKFFAMNGQVYDLAVCAFTQGGPVA